MREQMRTVLEHAAREELRRVFDTEHGQPKWPAPHQTLDALERRGYVERSERLSRHQQRVQVWTITEEGKAALKPPEVVGTERPVFPARGGGSTSDWTRAVDHDPRMGALDDMGAPSEEWLRVSRVKRAAAEDPKTAGKRISRALRAA